MKSLVRAALVATALIVPAASFAQGSTITRAQVRAELEQLESVGYHIGDGDQAHYPAGIQAAEAKLAARNGVTAYGGAAGGASQAGGRVSQSDWNAMYSR